MILIAPIWDSSRNFISEIIWMKVNTRRILFQIEYFNSLLLAIDCNDSWVMSHESLLWRIRIISPRLSQLWSHWTQRQEKVEQHQWKEIFYLYCCSGSFSAPPSNSRYHCCVCWSNFQLLIEFLYITTQKDNNFREILQHPSNTQ